jgi:nucleotide-binding universal stress UspA family protein
MRDDFFVYKRILVPVDGSAISRRAVKEAVRLIGEQRRGAIRLVHVVDETPIPWDEGAIYRGTRLSKKMQDAGARLLEREAKAIRGAGLKPQTRLVTRHSFPERVGNLISDEAKRWRADLIIMGTHGRSGVSRLVMGSVAETVVRLAVSPVLLIRSR